MRRASAAGSGPGIRLYLFLLALVAILPLAGAAIYRAYDHFMFRTMSGREASHEMARALAAALGAMMVANRELLSRLAARPGMEVENPERCDPLLAELHGLGRSFANITITNRAGDVVCSAVQQPGGGRINVGDSPYFRKMLESEAFTVSEPFLGPITGERVVAQIHRRTGADGRIVGAVGAPLRLNDLHRLVLSILQNPEQQAYVISADGQIVSTSDESPKRVGQSVAGTAVGEALLQRALHTFEARDLDGTARYFSVEPVPGTSWMVVVGTSREKMLAPVIYTLQLTLAGIIAALALTAVMTWIMGRRISQPIAALETLVHRVGAGETYLRADARGPREVAAVSTAFNSMLGERERAEAELRKLNAELEQRVAQRTVELLGAKERAEAADRMKSIFLATMSHELRTPLNSIIGFTGIILQELAGPLNDEQKKQLGMVRASARHLLALINNVLDISKIEAGELTVAREAFDMRQAVESVAQSIAPAAAAKGLALRMEVAPEIRQIASDRRRVEQVLLNLVNNAVKFTDGGEVCITCEIRDGTIATRVRDTGVGIKPEDLDRLFQPFMQLNSGLARVHEGTGLGLSISRKLAKLLGGDIAVESRYGAGSTFTFTLPLR